MHKLKLLRLYLGVIKALLRRYSGCIKALKEEVHELKHRGQTVFRLRALLVLY